MQVIKFYRLIDFITFWAYMRNCKCIPFEALVLEIKYKHYVLRSRFWMLVLEWA
jgi:hypothetical protein